MIRYCSLFMLIATCAFGALPPQKHNLEYKDLAAQWDEAVPLGNGMLGALIWQEGNALRFSLDRADLWDKRPVENFTKPEFRFDWMYECVQKGDIESVRKLIDAPYDSNPAPTKIPAGRIEFDQTSFGKVEGVRLDLGQALCTVAWDKGSLLKTFIHATEPVGWFLITGATTSIQPRIVPPPFGEKEAQTANPDSLNTHKLSSLQYPAPELKSEENFQSYRQVGWGGFEFAIVCAWRYPDEHTIEGVWTIQSSDMGKNPLRSAQETIRRALKRSFDDDWKSHKQWWSNYWNKSSISIPDPVIEAQWYREQYKFGSASRRGAPPITLQAVWTADNRQIPPWKGDFHHDLNTELSYWPCYSGNHLEEGLAFLDWLWKIKPTFERYTKQFYRVDGLAAHGVTTIEGQPMGGWNQYSCSPTTSAWLAHHFYQHWRYSQDREFLKKYAYPWIRGVALFLQEHSIIDENGRRKLPLSSSPEINDNRLDAWFHKTTNYDLALIRWTFQKAAELAHELGNESETLTWEKTLADWPELARSPEDGRLLVAPDYPLKESHRHFSHLMAIHPLGLIDVSKGETDRKTIESSLAELERLGPDYWCGYSYSWLGSLYARAGNGEKAANALRTFADCFCSINSFHLNGDQTKSGKSKMTYRPFTLEGNFAFAAGAQEMLLQSHTGVVRIFPAIPESWKDASFQTLRAEGAFLISADRKEGKVQRIEIISEKGGKIRVQSPFETKKYLSYGAKASDISEKDGILEIQTDPGNKIDLERE